MRSFTAVGVAAHQALVFSIDQTAMRLSSGAGPNCSALMKNSVFLIWPWPPARRRRGRLDRIPDATGIRRRDRASVDVDDLRQRAGGQPAFDIA